MKTLYVSFLWHLHQPLYKDNITNSYILPWVRFHSTKGYYDMAHILSDFPEIKVTFNITPSLIFQIMDIAKNNINDYHYEVSKKEADALSEEEQVFLLSNFFLCNWETMVFPYPRFRQLLEKRGRNVGREELQKKRTEFTEQELRDIQVFYNLVWFGNKARKDEFIKGLFAKGSNFTEEEKQILLKKQIEIIASIIPKYKELQDKGQIEISTSPFYHPILPLLLEREGGFGFVSDAEKQLTNALNFYANTFEKQVNGIWPPEGGVSDNVFPLLLKHGIKWCATDEEILFNTIPNLSRNAIYKMYDLLGIKVFFRDKNLSNLISFTYSHNKPADAVSDFISYIERIRDCVPAIPGEHIVSIILDGENPWEFYKDSGYEFLSGIYKGLSNLSNVKTTTFSGFLEINPDATSLSHIFPGSWIDHSFRIWGGKIEKDKAWNYLKKTRDKLLKTFPDKVDAWEEIYIAEGSDWFWWYGDDFNSSQDDVFDLIFRTHLKNVYRMLGERAPLYLDEPITKPKFIEPQTLPSHSISPIIDGRITSYYEWLGSGEYDINFLSQTMYYSENRIKKIRYGYDLNNLYIAISFTNACLDNEVVAINIETKDTYKIIASKDKGKGGFTSDLIQMAFDKILEIAIPFKLISVKPKDEIRFTISFERDEVIVESWPRLGYISIFVPTAEYEALNWSC